MRHLFSPLARWAAIAMVCAASGSLAWQPPRNSPERAAIMDSIRPSVERELDQPVIFRVEALNIEGPWAFASVRALQPNGRPVDWRRTRHAQAIANDAMSDSILALLRGGGQQWQVVEFALGPTDVPWEEWAETHRIPRSLFEQAYER
jgi:hypothetical protein